MGAASVSVKDTAGGSSIVLNGATANGPAVSDPAKLWEYYLQLTEIEQAFKELKGDLSIRPIHHQLEHRIESHIFISFIAYPP